MKKRPQKLVLIVDDQEDDQRMLGWMLGKAGVTNRIHFLTDGHEAIRYLNGDEPYSDRARFPFPAAMFLDLQMKVVDGWQVLDWIFSINKKGPMRIFVYSQPKNISEVQELYRLRADSFVRKPVSVDEIQDLIRNFPEPWELKPETAMAGGESSL